MPTDEPIATILPMRIGIVSDTHGHVTYASDAVRVLEQEQVEAVLHCGDIGSPKIIPLFAKWPAHFVFGNVDYDEADLRAAIAAAGQTCHDRFGELELAGVKIALLHGDDGQLLQQSISSGRYGLVCHGHTHVPRNERIGKTLVLNPGALYRASPHTVAVLDLPSLMVRHIPVANPAG